MKVCMVTSSYPRWHDDGAGSFVRSLAAQLGTRGHSISVFAPHDGGTPNPPLDTNVAVRYVRYAPSTRFRLVGYGRALNADVSLRPQTYVGLGGFLVAGFGTLLKHVIDSKCDVLHAHWIVPGGFLAAMVSRVTRVPLLVSVHGSDVYVSATNRMAGLGASFALRTARSVAACSPDLCERTVRLGSDRTSTVVIPYGVDAIAFAPKPHGRALICWELGFPADSTIILAVGRLVQKKGFEYLIRSFPAIAARSQKPVRLIIGGGGDLRETLESLAQQLGIGRLVRFVGPLGQSEVARYLGACDIAVVPSIRDDWGNVDGLPNVLLEAMSSGCSVVATDAGGIASVVFDEVNGYLVPERSVDALSDKVLQLVNEPDRRTLMGEAARATVLSAYGWDAIAERYEGLYEAISRLR